MTHHNKDDNNNRCCLKSEESRIKNVTFSPQKRHFRERSTTQKKFVVVRSLYVQIFVKIDAKFFFF